MAYSGKQQRDRRPVERLDLPSPEEYVEHRQEMVSIQQDVYNMFFLSNFGGQAFFYATYIFILKMTLYSVLALEVIEEDLPESVNNRVLVAQFLMLPVAVAMQEDLTATYYLIANIKFSPALKAHNPHATNIKFHVANVCRGMDGMYSLFVNFIIMVKAQTVVNLFLNFAALQFLQIIDNIALQMAADGYLSDQLETVACSVQEAKLPKKSNPIALVMDSILFLATYVTLLVSWALIHFY